LASPRMHVRMLDTLLTVSASSVKALKELKTHFALSFLDQPIDC